MKTSAIIEPSHAIVLINDPMEGEVPDFVDSALIMATDSCIMVVCQSYVDGPVEVVLGNTSDVDPGTTPAFETKLKTPSHRIAIETSDGDTVLETPTRNSDTVVRVWTNAPWQPDKVIVGVD